MANRKIPFVTGEIHHLYNRGNDKRAVFKDIFDLKRFFLGMELFNNIEPIKSIWFLRGETPQNRQPLVEFICYCLNPNHFHFLIKQIIDGGISEFMKRIGGYTCYFNEKYKRSGSLFEGTFKSTHIESNTQLLHTSAYINLNNHFKGEPLLLSKSSWNEYIEIEKIDFCKKDIILNQFIDLESFKSFALSSLEDIIKRKNLGVGPLFP